MTFFPPLFFLFTFCLVFLISVGFLVARLNVLYLRTYTPHCRLQQHALFSYLSTLSFVDGNEVHV